MTDLKLTYAGAPYLDRMAALQHGIIEPAGIDLHYYEIAHVGELFRRMAQNAEFEASEMSTSTLMLMISQGDDRLIGLPVFPSRAFRHSQIYIHAGSGIERPEDLVGRNVGIPEYQMTAALWQRAFLQHDHGVSPAQINWWTGGLKTPDYSERRHHDLPADVRLQRIPADRALEEMLDSGDLDALATAHAPDPFVAGSPNIRRLFEDYRSVEEDYFRRTGFFPVMHTVVVRRDVYESDPWVVESLLDAFEESKRLSHERLRDLDTLAIAHPWIAAEMDDVVGLFGRDPFRSGYAENLPLLEAMTQYSYEQGLSVRKLDPDEMFATEAKAWSPGPDPFLTTRA